MDTYVYIEMHTYVFTPLRGWHAPAPGCVWKISAKNLIAM